MKEKLINVCTTILLVLIVFTLNSCDKDPGPEPEGWECTEPIENDPEKLVVGRWERSKYLDGYETVNGKSVEIYKRVEKPQWLEFKSNGELIREYYNKNLFPPETGTYSIDTLLLQFHFNQTHYWRYNFSDCNDTLRMYLTSTMGFDELKFIYTLKSAA